MVQQPDDITSDDATPDGVDRRQFIGYLLAGSTLIAAAPLGSGIFAPDRADAAIPSVPELADVFDLTDLQTLAAMPTSNLIAIQIHTDGTASFALPRAEVGQGITTSTAMIIAEELDLPLDKVHITLAPARPELVFNQLTGGSNTTNSTYTPIRVAAAIARGALLDAAAILLGDNVHNLSTQLGQVIAKSGAKVSYGDLALKAAIPKSTTKHVTLKDASSFKIIGTPQKRIDAHDIVTGKKTFAMDMSVPNALPTMVCRAPSIKGTPKSVQNAAEVKAMPGITDVAMISTGVAVRGETFGQCIDAVRALQVTWNKGTEDASSDATILAALKRAELPMVLPKLPLLTKSIDATFTFRFASNTALEPNCAIADVRKDGAEIWAGMKSPLVAQKEIANKLGMTIKQVKVNVVEGGGSFGRKLFQDAALEAAEASQAMGKPVKLMWHRTDEFRHGRTHPMSTSHVRASYLGKEVLACEQRHTSISTDFTHGLGEMLTSYAAKLPAGDYTFAQSIFMLTQTTPYNFGVTTQLLNEVDKGFNTGSMRNIYSPNVRCAQELIVDQLAAQLRPDKDPYKFRQQFLKDPRMRAVLDKAAEVGDWGRAMPTGTAQGIAVHAEYKGACAAVVEIDCRPATVNRKIPEAYTGPRVTKVVFVVDVGLPVNPLGLQAQMMGGIMDGIALALSSSLHLENGHFAEGSWDDYHYTRQWNTPPELELVVMPTTTGVPGGAGEFGVAASFAATACAYARATGKMPTEFPINHQEAFTFTPLPVSPPIPQSPTNGLQTTY
jgi:isoquinoline 1-oxidoreductase beta subunit